VRASAPVPLRQRRTPCTFLCTALRVAAFGLHRESARFWGKSAHVRCTRDSSCAGHLSYIEGVHVCPPKGFNMSQSLTQLLLAYLPLIVFIGVAAVIGLALLVVPFLVAYKQPDPEKLSAYECGFNAFDDARMKFDVRFYLVAILFIIFDLEVSFLFPWAAVFGQLGVYGFWSMMVFLAVLTVGFVYEWKKGALEWD
jgi:NADH-quinone oxidoreductase subunit A